MYLGVRTKCINPHLRIHALKLGLDQGHSAKTVKQPGWKRKLTKGDEIGVVIGGGEARDQKALDEQKTHDLGLVKVFVRWQWSQV